MEDDVMTAKEMARLADWLKAHGHSDEEAIECLKYIAGETIPREKGKEKGHAPNPNDSDLTPNGSISKCPVLSWCSPMVTQ